MFSTWRVQGQSRWMDLWQGHRVGIHTRSISSRAYASPSHSYWCALKAMLWLRTSLIPGSRGILGTTQSPLLFSHFPDSMLSLRWSHFFIGKDSQCPWLWGALLRGLPQRPNIAQNRFIKTACFSLSSLNNPAESYIKPALLRASERRLGFACGKSNSELLRESSPKYVMKTIHQYHSHAYPGRWHVRSGGEMGGGRPGIKWGSRWYYINICRNALRDGVIGLLGSPSLKQAAEIYTPSSWFH